jgi:fimbrial chaperone protein
MIALTSFRRTALARAVAFISLATSSACAAAQSLTVLPVNVFFSPGQKASTLTVTNRGDRETAIQIRPYAWTQADGNDQLEATHTLAVSPPIASIAPGGTQLVRLILRDQPGDREVTFRILLDELPTPGAAGVVNVVFRLSIPVFSKPAVRAAPRLEFHLEREAGQVYLVGRNDGQCHDAIRDIALLTRDGTKLTSESGTSPYLLAGATRRWRIVVPNSTSLPNDTLRFTAHADSGAIDEQVRVVSRP